MQLVYQIPMQTKGHQIGMKRLHIAICKICTKITNIYTGNVEGINDINMHHDNDYKLGLNQFTDRTKQEYFIAISQLFVSNSQHILFHIIFTRFHSLDQFKIKDNVAHLHMSPPQQQLKQIMQS